LVAINGDINLEYEDATMVRSINDLIRVADEVCKPIMYRYSPSYEDITKYYVYDNTKLYAFDLINYLDITSKMSTIKSGMEANIEDSQSS
jgi:hypothetical protein